MLLAETTASASAAESCELELRGHCLSEGGGRLGVVAGALAAACAGPVSPADLPGPFEDRMLVAIPEAECNLERIAACRSARDAKKSACSEAHCKVRARRAAGAKAT
mmetsp:Transcript_74779/g.137795  ORF Transcript_74779/g.137795 Transcript_74779/m.137795 type:complete len:107 (+) Transcript_74779:1092-1412(+)